MIAHSETGVHAGRRYFRPAPFLYGQTLIACAAAISGPFSVCYLFKGLKYTKYSCALKKASYEKIPRFCLTAPTIRACLDFSFHYYNEELSARVFGAGRAKWEAILPYCEHFAMSWGKRTGDKIEKGCLDFYWENDV